MQNNRTDYLNPQFLSKIANLELRVKLVVEGFITGLHKSPFHGFSVEFSQHRPYNYGDSLRFVDWKVYGRTDRFYIKQFEEETNLRANIILDVSNSMTYGSTVMTKLEYGKHLAAALAYLTISQRDAAGLTLFDDRIRKIIPPRSVSSYLQLLFQELDQVSPGKDTDLSVVLHESAERLKRRGLVILISDLLDEPDKLISGLKHFRHNKHEVLIFHILDPRELDLDFDGDVIFQDMETDDKLKTFPWFIKEQYKTRFRQFTEKIRTYCLENRIDYKLITTNTGFDEALTQFLIKRMKLN